MKRLRVVTGLRYPYPNHLQAVLDARGRGRKLTKEQKDKFFKTAKRGEWCDDMPKMSVSHHLENGDVEEVEAETPKKASPKTASSPKKGAK